MLYSLGPLGQYAPHLIPVLLCFIGHGSYDSSLDFDVLRSGTFGTTPYSSVKLATIHLGSDTTVDYHTQPFKVH